MFIEDTFAESSLKGSSVRVVTAKGNLLNGMTFFKIKHYISIRQMLLSPFCFIPSLTLLFSAG